MKIHFFDEASTDCVDRCCLVQSARNRKDGENNVVIRGETRSVFRIKRPKKTFVAHGKSHKHALDKISEKHASHNDGLINEFGVIELAIKCHFDTRAISTRIHQILAAKIPENQFCPASFKQVTTPHVEL